MAAYDEHGLWSYQGIRFSRAGTLLATVADLVEQAPAGRFADELGRIVQVEVRNALGKLVRARRLAREKLAGRFLYCSPTPLRRERQVRTRRVLLGVLDERQRRLYAGLESLRHGRGGDGRVAAQLGTALATVAEGRRQLLAGNYETERIRKPGGGRTALEKKPALTAQLVILLRHDTAGDPCSDLRWTRRTTRNLAAWWRSEGSARYPEASQLVLLVDCGGSNSYRARAWKYALQHGFCNVLRLPVTVARYPAGCLSGMRSDIASSARSAAIGRAARWTPSI